MPRQFYGASGVHPAIEYDYRTQEDPDARRMKKLGALEGFLGNEEADPRSMMQMLGSLYGIKEHEREAPLQMQLLRSQIAREQAHAGEAKGREAYLETQAKEYGPAHMKAQRMTEEVTALASLFGGTDAIPEGLKRDLLKRHGYNPDELVGAPPAGIAGETPTQNQPQQNRRKFFDPNRLLDPTGLGIGGTY